MKIDDFKTIVTAIDVVNGKKCRLLSKLLMKVFVVFRFVLIAAVRKSTMRQQTLQKLQKLKHADKTPLRLVRRAPTRWNSLYDVIDRFLKVVLL